MLIDGTIESGKLLDELRLAHPEAGAVVCFTGQVRGANETDPVKALYLEDHPDLTWPAITAEISKIRSEIELAGLDVWHRIGLIPAGETIVHVAAAARHRRNAFLAADRMMDYLKTEAIFWKREDRQSGSKWIEPRSEDYKDAKRWQNSE